MATYDHTQKSPLFFVFLGTAVLLLVLAFTVASDPAGRAIALCVSAMMFLSAFSFKYLRVRDDGDCVAIRFGPLPILGRRIPYSQITGVDAGRQGRREGWGVRSVGFGWSYKLWGFDGVVVHLGEKALWIGSDDAEGLLGFLKSKIAVPER